VINSNLCPIKKTCIRNFQYFSSSSPNPPSSRRVGQAGIKEGTPLKVVIYLLLACLVWK